MAAAPDSTSKRNGSYNFGGNFFAVYIPPADVSACDSKDSDSGGDGTSADSETATANGGVFDSLQSAVDVVKKFKNSGARFKNFTNADEALAYARDGVLPVPSADKCGNSQRTARIDSPVAKFDGKFRGTPSLAAEEKSILFPAPSRPQLNRLRKAIEQQEQDFVEWAVMDNPRYLINCNSDSPTVLFEGCRYNAMHIAAKSGNFRVCELILRLFGEGNTDYVKMLYVDDSTESADRRRRFLFDMYLNTPDKALHETPLHFAVKFGRWDIVKLLYSVPTCDRHAKNKYGESAPQLAKNRGMQQITSSFCLDDDENRVTSSFVGLYRDVDFVAPPIIRLPCVGFPPTSLDSCSGNESDRRRRVTSPGLSPVVRLMAYAGPMSAETAKRFHADWCSRKVAKSDEKAASAKRSDLHKGAERLGRALSARYKVEWREFWPFLNKFCDLSSPDGCAVFEAFLREKLSSDEFRLQADELSRKLLALPSPFFDDFPRPSRKRPRKKLDFGVSTNPCDEDADTFYDTYDSILSVGNNVSILIENEDSNDQDTFSTPPETPPTVFISGRSPTKTDFEAFTALESVELDGDKFPLLRRWKDRISLFSNEDRTSWPAFDSPRAGRYLLNSGKDDKAN